MQNQKSESKSGIAFADNLSRLRKEHGFSQENLAEKLNVSRQTISKWENAQCLPETEKLVLLSDILETDVDALMKSDQEINPEGNSESHPSVITEPPVIGEMKNYSKLHILFEIILVFLLGFCVICVLAAFGIDEKYPSLIAAVFAVTFASSIVTFLRRNR